MIGQNPAKMGNAGALALTENYSLEMTGKDVSGLQEVAAVIPPGTRINITFLGQEDLNTRMRAAKAVKDLGFVPVPHISARRIESQGQLEEFLGCLQEAGASDHVLIVGGDPDEPAGPYPHALSVIESGLLERFGVKSVSIAGYPEGHPHIGTDVIWRHLEDKIAALKAQRLESVILSQFAFDAGAVVDWIADVRARGIDNHIRVGTPGPAGVKRLIAMARRFGIGANAMILKKYGFSLTNLVGTAGPDAFVSQLVSSIGDAPPLGRINLHFYTFGDLNATSKWARDYLVASN